MKPAAGSALVLTASNIDVDNDATVTAGELEVGDTFDLEVAGAASITGTLDLEPGANLKLGTSLTVNSGGTFEAIGGTGYTGDLAVVTTNDTGTPTHYSFSIAAGGIINAQFVYFRYMDSNGIQITDNGSVTALTQLDNAYFDKAQGGAGSRLLKITDNDNAVTLSALQFFDDGAGSLTYNVETVNASATITIDPYDDDTNASGFGGSVNEQDNGNGEANPPGPPTSYIDWGSTTTPVLLSWFEATRVAGGVLLEWETGSEWRSLGFAIERSLRGKRDFTPLGPPVIRATGSPVRGEPYYVLDDEAETDVAYLYRLMEIDSWGMRRAIATTEVDPLPPERKTRLARVWGVPRLRSLPHGSGVRTARSDVSGHLGIPSLLRSHAASQSASSPPGNAVKVLVEEEGVIRLPYTLLADAGFPVESPLESFRLRRGKTPWPMAILDGDDGRFEPGDAIDFVAAPFQSLETRYDVYWLEIAAPGEVTPRIPNVDGKPGVSSAPLGASMAERTLEENAIYVISLFNGEGRDHWFWEYLLAPGMLEIPFRVDALVSGSPATEVEVHLEGWNAGLFSSIDHRTVVSLNGVELGEFSSNGVGPYGGTLEIPEGYLLEGSNLLTLTAVALVTPDLVFLDRITISYLRAHLAVGNHLHFSAEGTSPQRLEGFGESEIELYQISGPGSPRRVVGGELSGASPNWSLTFIPPTAELSHYEAFSPAGARLPAAVLPASPSELRDPPRGADYIIICPREFMREVEPLARLRQTTGLRVEMVPLEEIYDQFDGGRTTTDAIGRFLRHAWRRWPRPAPEYVLLVGDATYDPRGNLGPSPRQVLPTRLVDTRYIETASDAWFGDVEGDDGAPELSVGRLPVATLTECRAVVEKILRYQRRWLGTTGAHRAILVADEEPDFPWMNDGIEMLLPPGMESVSLELGPLSIEELREALFSEWWQGALLVHYSGHGGRTQWSADGILLVEDVPELGSRDRLPLVTAMNCLNGFFHHPGSPSLGEALLLEPTGGAIAYWGPTGVTLHLPQKALAERFYWELLGGGTETVGRAIRIAERELAPDPENQPILATWILMGDPALRLR